MVPDRRQAASVAAGEGRGALCRRLLVVSHVCHYAHDSRLWAYAPYVREIDVWAGLFSEVVIAAPAETAPPPADCAPFAGANISVLPVRMPPGSGPAVRLRQAAALPAAVWQLAGAMRRADAVHVRCPGNLGLLGALLAPLLSRRMVAKYAGQWPDYPGEVWTARLQKRLLRSWWWRGPVTVYGEWPGQGRSVVPFFSSALSLSQMAMARVRAVSRQAGIRQRRLLFVGRLSASKNVDAVVQALAILRSRGEAWTFEIAGDGEERARLEFLVRSKGLEDQVRFLGGLAFEDVLAAYERADVLVLVSETEGWPKAIVEGMAFGLVCVGSARGLVPQILGDGRGLVVPPGDPTSLAEALECLAADPEGCDAMRTRAAAWAQEYSLDGLGRALERLLADAWRLDGAARAD